MAPLRLTLLLLAMLACSFSSLLYAAETSLPEISMTFVKGGCYVMGDQSGNGALDERPAHQVCVDDFRLGTFEVTEAQWLAVMGDPPRGTLRGAEYPVERVTWTSAREFIRRLNERTRLHYRLPTEAEWEYASRGGGKVRKYAGTDNDAGLADSAWYEANSGNVPHPVGRKQGNELGLFDLNGNVWEWVSDRYDSFYYRHSPRSNPAGDPFGVNRVMRGGSYASAKLQLRTTNRDYLSPAVEADGVGFRLAESAIVLH